MFRMRRRADRKSSKRWVRLGIEELEARVVPTLLGQQLFPLDSAWNQVISSAPVAANSAAVINNIGSTIQFHPDFSQDDHSSDPLYGIPYNIVSGSQPKVHVTIDAFGDESDLLDVPIPANAVIEGDFRNGPNVGVDNRGDSHLIVWDKDNNIVYELYRAQRPSETTDGLWHADGEAVWDLKQNSFRTLGFTSADAAGLPILPGLIRPDEGLPVSQGGQGVITHALRFTLQNSKVLGQYIYPASHEANSGTNQNLLVPMGARFRLKASVDISGLNPQARIIAQAMKDYGMILADNGSSFFVSGASDAVDASNQRTLTWNDNDIQDSVHGLKSLRSGDFELLDLTPRVTGLSVSSAAPGATLTVTGQNFSGAAGHLSVIFGSSAVPAAFVDDTHLTCTVPTGTGTVAVTVRSGVIAAEAGNIRDPIFGYGVSTTSASFTFGQGGGGGPHPPVAVAGGPYSAAEGSAFTLDGSGSSDPDQTSTTLSYAWDLNYDGVAFDSDVTGRKPSVTLTDNFASRNIALRVTDATGLFSIATTSLTVTNVPPVVSITGPTAGLPDAALTFTLGATDPSSVDLAAGFTFSIDWDGDNVVDQIVSGPAGLQVSHTYPATGTFTVRVSATDKDGGTPAALASSTVSIAQIGVVPDPLNPIRTALSITADDGDDTILVQRGAVTGTFRVFVNNVLQGTFAANGHMFIYGQDGNDSIRLAAGITLPTLIFGGNGNDTLTGSLGPVTLDGGAGDDSLLGGAGADVLTGGPGDDILNGGAGGDRLVETADADFTLIGGTTVTNGSLTGLGNDVLIFNTIETARLTGGDGNNTLNTSAFVGRVTLDGGNGDDVLISGKNSDRLLGNAGNDTITGGLGSDTIDGGTGVDRLIEAANVSFTLTATSLIGVGTDRHSNLEEVGLTGGVSANTFTLSGWAGTATIDGGSGAADKLAVTHDTSFTLSPGLVARSSAGDIAFSNIAQVALTGGAGANTFDVTTWPGPATLNGGTGLDTLLAGNLGNAILTNTSFTRTARIALAGIENARLSADDGGRTINAAAFTGKVTLLGGAGNDSLLGGGGNDVLLGNDGDDTLLGTAGRDFLVGGLGADLLIGGSGEDLLANGTLSAAYDVLGPAFASVIAEWSRTDTSYGQRVASLKTGGGLNGTNLLDGSSLLDDADADIFNGGLNLDWFFAGTVDTLTDILDEQLN